MPKRAFCQGCDSWSGVEFVSNRDKGKLYCLNTFCPVGEVKFARAVDVDEETMNRSVAEAQKRFNEEANR